MAYGWPASGDALDRVGTWDGKTPTATLDGPYEDALQMQVEWPRHSFMLTPWRAYMDTWPATRFLDSMGTNGLHNRGNLPISHGLGKVMRDVGLTHTRLEFAWSHFDYDDPTQLKPEHREKHRAELEICREYGIRPIILLNGNHGAPCPFLRHPVRLVEPAEAGSRTVVIDRDPGIQPGRTGLMTRYMFRGKLRGRKMGFPLITSAERMGPKRLVCTLSAPLAEALPAGPQPLFTLKYPPYGGKTLADGTPNPGAQAFIDGWRLYTKAVTDFAVEVMGTRGSDDMGFDLHVWNEYSFGSDFLWEKRYYDPPREFSEWIRYRNHGREYRPGLRWEHELILPVTVDYVNDPANGLPGVQVVSGFSNQRPFDNGTTMWPGQAGLGKHLYSRLDPQRRNGISLGIVGPDSLNPRLAKLRGVDARGELAGTADGEPYFVPSFVISHPEQSFYAYQTEFIVRDLQPMPGPFKNHFRYGHPGDGRYAEVWFTEYNQYKWFFADQTAKAAEVELDDPRLLDLVDHVAAKSLLRSSLFFVHKGVDRIYNFTIVANPKNHQFVLGFAIIQPRFTGVLERLGDRVTASDIDQLGAQIGTLYRTRRAFEGAQPMAEARPLRVAQVVEHQPRLVFRGDGPSGTPGAPDRFHRDDLAVLPYQLDARTFIVPYYVVTRNLAHVWDESRPLLDPARYDMPDQDFEVVLENLAGVGARVSVYDPMTDRALPVEVLEADGDSIRVKVPTVDYPRLLRIEEASAGPLVTDPVLQRTGQDSAELTFVSNGDAEATVTWGAFPGREGRETTRSVRAGEAVTVELNGFRDGSAARVRLSANGLEAVWPRWDHDTDGAFDTPMGGGASRPRLAGGSARPTPSSPRDAGFELPSLDAASKPHGFEVNERLATPVAGRKQTWEVAGATVSFVEGLRSTLRGRLPQTSLSDSVDVTAGTWGGVPAWRIDYLLDLAAHPGATRSSQLYWVAPCGDGYVVMVIPSEGGATPAAEARAKDAVVFEAEPG
ncbi:MAG: hypothetical protein AAFX76_06195 [Planctomycetota bacterium]